MANEDGVLPMPEYFLDHIDTSTFEQILEMDDDGDHEFSSGIVHGFFDQAESTFTDMESRIASKDLPALSSLGHFLKGSSATLGLTKVKDGCEKVQHYGSKKDDSGEPASGSDEEFLQKIKKLLPTIKEDYDDAKKVLTRFFEEQAK